ncbi:leucine--tRNA ligase [Alicyclobacillus tolerans]|uniref:Leucine--tRNA ligase n=2 Tax=Alicyclobacillus tolerans TaxID=90970 RepID=A0ABT9LY48_9BACL|nr:MULTISPECIES: leucine--tRNA ligase [Alicyclobacillus]MDP9729184.1 leucyl-tRNA synthetase [Alicyclobacillus tengchongensis]QRF22668.1 leucine--tRNA ligase [Alicyclobacillus sp. TC]SHK03128.1 leucyl-tRNA synthetase [Alicyclobacillus montanus]
MEYVAKTIEAKWKEKWKKDNMSRVQEDSQKPKYYCLDMFPYPSGEGLHVGHWRGYTISDVWSRYKLLQGYDVLHPMGWDAFGLPAENYAIAHGVHPALSTSKNIQNFKRQLEQIGALYDWDREVNTSSPDFYHWTQFFFVKMFEKGLAYRKKMPINWCPSCKTGLANEEVVDGCCDRCGAEVTKREMNQWMLKITAYADRLLDDLDKLEWPEHVKRMQRAWIGRSEGARILFGVAGHPDEQIEVFSTRPDTLYGATYMVLAPEHPLVQKISTTEKQNEVNAYVEETLKKSAVSRQIVDKSKTGVFTGAYAIHPLTGAELPIWIADYVLMDYGTGAIMAVPAHDERDFEFAQTFGLPIRTVVTEPGKEAEDGVLYLGDGVLVNSEGLNGLTVADAKKAMIQLLEEKKKGEQTISYRLRDWVFARQRYWGEPIPILYCDTCGTVPVPVDDLPVRLPDVEKYEPTGTGESPLAAIPEFVNTTCPRCGGAARRETDTMPQWAGSSWYFLRYVDPHNPNAPFSKEKADAWLPVDMYIGGVEHAVLHLLYARFFTKVIHDLQMIDFDEPFQHLFTQGMITLNGAKMSKSKGNVVSPDEIIDKYGADALRMYEMFVGPPEDEAEWNTNGLEGVARFLQRLYRLFAQAMGEPVPARDSLNKLRHRFVATLTERMEQFRFNTAVSAFMEYINALQAESAHGLDLATLETLAVCLSPFAPHLGEELWSLLGHSSSVFATSWPKVDEKWLRDDEVELVVQINGRVRGHLRMPADASQEAVIASAKKLPEIIGWLNDGVIVKEVYVPGKLLNLVVKA